MLLRQNTNQNQKAFLWTVFKSFALIASLLGSAQNAFAEPQPEEIIQDSVSEVITENQGAILKFKVSENVSYEIQAEPDFDKLEFDLITGLFKDPFAGYKSLSLPDKEKFQQRRLDFLKKAAQVFYKTKFVLGVGSLVGKSFSFVIDKALTLGGKPRLKVDDSLTLKQRSDRTAQNLLQSLDERLWRQAPLFIASNEYGVSMSVGFMALRGFREAGQGGGEEIGLSLGYNKQSRAFVFEIFHSSENFINSFAPVGLIGFPLKAGPFMAARLKGQETTSLKGESHYPMAMPGFSAENSEYFTSGFNSSIGLPPSPIVDMMTYNNSFDRKTLIRITVSPLVVGYLRIQFGDIKGSMKLIGTRVSDVVKTVAEKTRQQPQGACHSIFT